MLILKISACLLLTLFLIAFIERTRPLSKLIFSLAEKKLLQLKERSLANPSPFESVAEEKWVMESANAYVINDIKPRAPHHFLIIPKRRINTLMEAEGELLQEMLNLAKKLAVEQGFANAGFRTIINTNPHGFQTVYHLHIHVLAGRQMMLHAG